MEANFPISDLRTKVLMTSKLSVAISPETHNFRFSPDSLFSRLFWDFVHQHADFKNPLCDLQFFQVISDFPGFFRFFEFWIFHYFTVKTYSKHYFFKISWFLRMTPWNNRIFEETLHSPEFWENFGNPGNLIFLGFSRKPWIIRTLDKTMKYPDIRIFRTKDLLEVKWMNMEVNT